MKRFYYLPFLLLLSINSFSQTPVVHFDFLSHNEETTTWDGPTYYSNNRSRLITLANYFHANGITWNMQSDWKYLSNVILQDSAFYATTNNKNILRWMYEDQGVEMDPHAHESVYIYPDVVKLMDSIGLPESKLMGGSIYNDSNGTNIWTNLINGQSGNIFPDKFWQPDYMMGGGTPNHVADLKYYGFWNPQSTSNYLTHDTSNHLRHIGVGCEIKIKDTTTVGFVVSQLREVLQNVQDGTYPSNGFYIQAVFFEQGDLNNMLFYNKLITIADSMNAMVASGAAEWKTLKQSYVEWETTYNAQMFQWECGQVATGTNDFSNENENIIVYPNPFLNKINVRSEIPPGNYELINFMGQTIWEGEDIESKDFGELPYGFYFLQVKNNNSTESYKILKQ